MKSLQADLSNPIDLSIPLQAGHHNPNAFGIADPEMKAFQVAGFIGKVSAGGPCNVEDISFSPHGNGTHTECVGHISAERFTINHCLKRFWFRARLISLLPESREEDAVISKLQLLTALGDLTHTEAVIVRTLPNTTEKLQQRYAGTNPAYFEPSALGWLREQGVMHLLTDLPSVDKEDDGGLLAAHHSFWHFPENPRMAATITELIFVDNRVPDGDYALNLMIAPFESDASPSKPVLYPLI
ncbi:MAG: cyclase family protein [Bacteroidia bacterium]